MKLKTNLILNKIHNYLYHINFSMIPPCNLKIYGFDSWIDRLTKIDCNSQEFRYFLALRYLDNNNNSNYNNGVPLERPICSIG